MNATTPRAVYAALFAGAAVLALTSAQAQTPVAPPAPAAVVAPTADWHLATELPNVDMSGLSAAQKDAALKILREESCNCGCSMKLAECRINDRKCPVSPGLATKVVQLVKEGKSGAEIKAAMVPAPSQASAPPPALGAKVEIPIAGAPTKGAAKAKVTIVEFSDFQCPFCSRAIPWVDSILAAYPNDVNLVFKQYPLPMHSQAKLAAEAALAANAQGKFWPMHDKLFENFRTISRDTIGTWAKELGLDMVKFDKALADGTYTKTVEQDIADGTKVGVRGTPTFFINGKLYNGGRDLESTKVVIDQELKGSAAAAPAAKAPEKAAEKPAEKPAAPPAKKPDAKP